MTNDDFRDYYGFKEHSACGKDIAAGWIVVALVSVCLLVLTL